MKQLRSLLLLTLLVAGAACNHVYYAPNTPNAPLLREKGESRITGLYTAGSDSEYGGGEVQLAHAIGNKTGLIASGFFAGREEVVNTDQTGSDIEFGRGSYVELGIGRFAALKPNSNWKGEIYAGAGRGQVNSRFSFGDFARTGYTKFFLQPTVAYRISRFEFAVVPRVGLVNWKVKEAVVVNSANDDHRAEIEVIRRNKTFLAFEPAFLVRGGNRNIKVQGGLSLLSYGLQNNEAGEDLAESLNLSVGLSLSLFPKKTRGQR